MTVTMTLGDALWDITIALSSIILINVVFDIRVKGLKVLLVYLFIFSIYLFADKLMFLQNKHNNWYLLYIVAYILEFIAIILAGYIAHGDLYRNFTYIALMQLTVSLLIGVVAVFDNNIKRLLYNDGLNRFKTESIKYYMYISFLQIIFAIIVSAFIKIILTLFSRDYIFYKGFFLFYVFYGILNVVFKSYFHVRGKYISVIVFLFVQISTVFLCIYFMIYLYNKKLRNTIETELQAINININKINKQYFKIVEENSDLDEFKHDLNEYLYNNTNSEYIDSYINYISCERYDSYNNPISGNIIFDSLIGELENELNKKNTILEITFGRNCKDIINDKEKQIDFIIKNIIDIIPKIKNNSYVVIGIRKMSGRLFVSIDMKCESDLNRKNVFKKLVTYLKIEKGYCVVNNNDDNLFIDAFI